MRIKKQTIFYMTFFLLLLAGCSQENTPQMVNELHYSLRGISEVTISYDEETITFFEADNDELTVKEYMTENKERYYADAEQKGNRIHISEGDKPFFKDGFSRHIEVYLPASYRQKLTVTTTDGMINMSDIELKTAMLRIDTTAGTLQLDHAAASEIYVSSTSGKLDLGHMEAEKIRLENTSGETACRELIGQVDYTSTSGNLRVNSAAGSGRYTANNSGRLQVSYSKVTGDLFF